MAIMGKPMTPEIREKMMAAREKCKNCCQQVQNKPLQSISTLVGVSIEQIKAKMPAEIGADRY